MPKSEMNTELRKINVNTVKVENGRVKNYMQQKQENPTWRNAPLDTFLCKKLGIFAS